MSNGALDKLLVARDRITTHLLMEQDRDRRQDILKNIEAVDRLISSLIFWEKAPKQSADTMRREDSILPENQ